MIYEPIVLGPFVTKMATDASSKVNELQKSLIELSAYSRDDFIFFKSTSSLIATSFSSTTTQIGICDVNKTRDGGTMNVVASALTIHSGPFRKEKHFYKVFDELATTEKFVHFMSENYPDYMMWFLFNPEFLND